ncbi:sodium:solute symporter family protein [Desulfogranum japonicum]|uniref:sodium:solute symporter family protein n=1 Tax=Desulfogranum japonicum TaxID=231447 RepID=UPI000407C495|nr:sodium:solute symporter family protein [Desulfogranum japonicum]
MNGFHLFLVILGIYLIFLVAVGIHFNKKDHSPSQFWLAGKSAGTLSIGFSAAASWLTAGGMLAVIGLYMLLGLGSIWSFVAPNIIALLVIAFFVKKIKSLPSITQPELLEMRYGNHLRLPVAIIITVVMILFAVADIKGLSFVLEIFYGLDPVYSALIVGGAVAVYVTLGGLSAVIATDTVQFLCLFVFTLIMAISTLTGASQATDFSVGQLLSNTSNDWWNPLSVGLPMVIIFTLAIVPGWITEQDPWQRVWAAKNEKSARNGMLLGSLLISIVFACCAIIAVALNVIYPDIAQTGFPMGMAQAEPALLTFIMDSHLPPLTLALCAIALAAAAMSCADTFAASGASCLARDIYQRYLHKDATMQQMRTINRISVLLIVICATAGSFFIHSIIDAIHIATFIASASYFFALMGGLYWKRATGRGAVASLWTGFIVQTGLILFDLSKTAPMAPPYLENIHPLLMSHGVIVSMLISGTVFIVVSLADKPCDEKKLTPFFAKEKSTATTCNIADDLPQVASTTQN